MDIQKLKRIANEQIARFNLTGWTFHTNNNKRRIGVCRYRSKRIEIQLWYAEKNDESEVMDTLMHEIAHALCPGHGHDSVWAAKARELGATPKACAVNAVVQDGDYKAVCPDCNKIFHLYRKPKYSAYHCGQCQGVIRFDPIALEVAKVAKSKWTEKYAWYQRVHPDGSAGKWIRCACTLQQLVNITVAGFGKEEEPGMRTRIAVGYATSDMEDIGIIYAQNGYIVLDRENNQPVQRLAKLSENEIPGNRV